jgi:twinkle protein
VQGLLHGEYTGLPKRRLTEETCRKFKYQIGTDNGQPIHIAPYYNDQGEMVAQKIRYPDKKFVVRGDMSKAGLFGQQLWSRGGKRVVVTEGELDALSFSQAAPSWPVVSIPNGAQSAVKAVKNSIEFLEGFDEVVFCFDNDEPGIKAAHKCAEIITPGKAKIASLPLKDASEMLVAGRQKELFNIMFTAKDYRPDGVINGKEIWNAVNTTQEVGIPYQWPRWNDVLLGVRPREICTLTAGSGVGKSTIAAQIAYDLVVNHQKTIGYIALEESVSRTGLRFMSLALGRPLHLPQDVSEGDRKAAFDLTLGTGRILMYDHFGSLDSDHLLNKLRYMVTGLGAEYLFIDHLSILLSGGDFMVSGGDERKQIDYTMSKLRQFTEQTGAGMFLISHLKRSSGDKGFEDGLDPTLSSLRGSQSIAQLSDSVVAISRNASDGQDRLKVRCLKNRYAGITGDICTLRYNRDTATLEEVNDDFDDEEEIDAF